MSRLANREMWISEDDYNYGELKPSLWACHAGDLEHTQGWHRLRISHKNQSWSGVVNGTMYIVPFHAHPGYMFRIGDATPFARPTPLKKTQKGPVERKLVTLEELFAEDDDV